MTKPDKLEKCVCGGQALRHSYPNELVIVCSMMDCINRLEENHWNIAMRALKRSKVKKIKGGTK